MRSQRFRRWTATSSTDVHCASTKLKNASRAVTAVAVGATDSAQAAAAAAAVADGAAAVAADAGDPQLISATPDL